MRSFKYPPKRMRWKQRWPKWFFPDSGKSSKHKIKMFAIRVIRDLDSEKTTMYYVSHIYIYVFCFQICCCVCFGFFQDFCISRRLKNGSQSPRFWWPAFYLGSKVKRPPKNYDFFFDVLIQEFSNIPQTPNQRFMKEFLSFGCLGIPGICSEGMLGFS